MNRVYVKKTLYFSINFAMSPKPLTFAEQIGVLAHLVERNTGSVEVSGSSPLYSTNGRFGSISKSAFLLSPTQLSVNLRNISSAGLTESVR